MQSNKEIPFSSLILGLLLVAGLALIGYLYLKIEKTSSAANTNISPVVSNTDGVQYIDITAKGGYKPNYITASAAKKTILRVNTSGTFDCSSSIYIPKLSYRANLISTGVTNINIPPQEPNTEIKGTCSMGMYRFTIKFI